MRAATGWAAAPFQPWGALQVVKAGGGVCSSPTRGREREITHPQRLKPGVAGMQQARDPKREAEKEVGYRGPARKERPTGVDLDPWNPSVAEFCPGSGSGSGSGSFVSSKGESGQPMQPFTLEKSS